MAMKMKVQDFMGKTEILSTVDHYIALGRKAPRATALAPGQTVVINERRILRVGTYWAAEGSAPAGLVADNYDLTDGDQQIAVIVHGVVNRGRLPVALTYAQEQSLPGILFVDGEAPAAPSEIQYIVDLTPAEHVTYAIEEGSHRIVKSGGSFAFKITIASGYHAGEAFAVSANGDELEEDDEHVYTVADIDSDVVIAVTGVEQDL